MIAERPTSSQFVPFERNCTAAKWLAVTARVALGLKPVPNVMVHVPLASAVTMISSRASTAATEAQLIVAVALAPLPLAAARLTTPAFVLFSYQ